MNQLKIYSSTCLCLAYQIGDENLLEMFLSLKDLTETSSVTFCGLGKRFYPLFSFSLSTLSLFIADRIGGIFLSSSEERFPPFQLNSTSSVEDEK